MLSGLSLAWPLKHRQNTPKTVFSERIGPMKARIVPLLLLLTLLLLGSAAAIPTAQADAQPLSGTYGTLTYVLSPDAGRKTYTLTISGSGAMPDSPYDSFTDTNALPLPWKTYSKQISQVVVEEGVTAIGAHVFYGYSALERVTIPNSVTAIGKDAFFSCKKLTSVTLPRHMEQIGPFAFAGCTSLTRFDVPQGVTELSGTFMNCASLKDVTLPEGITTLIGTFRDCSKLKEIDLPQSLEKMNNTFAGCTGLKSLVIPDSVTHITTLAFAQCKALRLLEIPASVQVLHPGCFKGTKTMEVYYHGNNWDNITKKVTGDQNTVPDRVKVHFVHCPRKLTVLSASLDSLSLSWTPVENAAGYVLYSALSPLDRFQRLAEYGPDTTHVTISDRETGRICYFRIQTVFEDNGEKVYDQQMSMTAQNYPTFSPSSAPTGVTATALSSSEIQLRWDTVEGAQFYQVYWAAERNGEYALLGTYASPTHSVTVKALSDSTYYYQVRAYHKIRNYRELKNDRAYTAFSDTVTATTLP